MALLQLQRERDHELRKIQSQLLLYESQMRQRNKEISVILREKDATIRLQREIILYFCKCFKSNLKTSKTPDTPDQNSNENKDLSDKGYSGNKNNQEKDKGGGECKLISDHVVNGSEDIQNKENMVSSLISSIAKGDQENLNDSDSAIMLEDNYDSFVFIPQGLKGEVKVVRSVSDAVEAASRSTNTTTIPTTPGETVTPSTPVTSMLKPGFSSGTGPGSLSTSPSCSSEESDDSPVCTLTKGRKELMRTVYSLEEEISHAQEQDQQDHDSLLDDTVSLQVSIVPSVTPSLHSILKTTSHYDSDATLSEGDSDDDDDDDSVRDLNDSCNDRRRLLGSYEKLNTLVAPVKPKPEEEIQVTYNRVMSNHRSVTKPKDVKYRRINKAKSRSLEELRGKLKYWTDRGGKQSLSVDLNTDSYA